MEAFLVSLGLKAATGLARRIVPLVVTGLVVFLLGVPIAVLVLFAAPQQQAGATVAPGPCAARVDAAPDDDSGHTRTTAELGEGWQANAATITAAAVARFPGADGQQAAIIALATAMQESRLANLDHGDRDSVGLFQQRAGWGSFAQRMDPGYAVGKFLDSLAVVPGWQTMEVTVAAQAVQRSGFPDAYRSWTPLAISLAGSAGQPCTSTAIAGPCPVMDVSEYGNGLIPPAALCPLASAPGQMLRGDAANAFAALNDAYRVQFGVSITVTDSYRDLPSQYDVYARKPGLAAKPGTSRHGLGQALDLGGGLQTAGTPQDVWMDANGPRFGWSNPAWARPGGSGPRENWHLEYETGR